ncbi:MAG: SDR family NAD(P)-dependent oxidoreductase [Candidatus Hodarchaeales archaeon]
MDLNNKVILVTGGCGFIGSHLVEYLLEKGARVRVFARYTSSGFLGNLSSFSLENIDIVYGDLRNYFTVYKAMEGVDIVFHLASLISIPYSYENPFEYFDVNVNAIINILQAARHLETELILHTSTSEVYGTAQRVPIAEDHPLQAQSPYSASKIAADKVVESYFLSFNLPVITIRPFNTFGPRQSTRAVIPTIINQLMKDKTLSLGDLTPTRDLLYVKDTVSGFVTAAKHYKNLLGQTLNIGTGEEIRIDDLALLIGQIMGVKPEFHTDPKKIRPEKSEVRRLCCDSSRFTAATGWKPAYNLKRGLEETIEYYRQNQSRIRSSSEFK